MEPVFFSSPSNNKYPPITKMIPGVFYLGEGGRLALGEED